MITPIVLKPAGSTSLAICKASEVEISAFAGITQRIIVLESSTYLKKNLQKNSRREIYDKAIDFVICSIFFGCSEPDNGIRVIPGKSIIVRSGHVEENIDKTMGFAIMFFFVPASRSVISLILVRTLSNSVIFSLVWSKTAHGLSSTPPIC